MFPILHNRALNASVSLMEVEAPYIARKMCIRDRSNMARPSFPLPP